MPMFTDGETNGSFPLRLSNKHIIQYFDFLKSKIRALYILQEQNGFPQLETLCLACGSMAGVPRTDNFLYRFVIV